MVEEDRGKQELRVYPQPVHMLAQVRGGPEVVELNEYLEGKVGQRVHYPNVLRPEALPKRQQTRRLQAITGQVPVRETIMRWYRHKGMDLPEEYMRCHCGQGQETCSRDFRCPFKSSLTGRSQRVHSYILTCVSLFLSLRCCLWVSFIRLRWGCPNSMDTWQFILFLLCCAFAVSICLVSHGCLLFTALQP